MEAKVVQILPQKYICIAENDRRIECVKNGNMKKNRIHVGDNVKIIISSNTNVITQICDRKNYMIRPLVSNIDIMILCVSVGSPKPDYILLDKQIVLCLYKNIKPVICITKVDLVGSEEVIKYIESVYGKYYDIIKVTTSESELSKRIFKVIKGKTSAFSGNSGVGKSSIINLLNKSYNMGDCDDLIEVGEIGVKSKKGKHTTKEVRLFDFKNNTFVLDTPGFSSYEVFDVEHKELKQYFRQFDEYVCSFADCRHTNEKEDVCAVKSAVAHGEIDKGLYERYLYIYAELLKRYNTKYL